MLPSLQKRSLAVALVAYAISLAILMGSFAVTEVALRDDGPLSMADALHRFDGGHYSRIAESGYSYERNRASDVAFFPIYPLVARCVGFATGCNVSLSLVVTSHAFLIATWVLLYWLAAHISVDLQPMRDDVEAPHGDGRYATAVVLSFCFFPPTFFFRMAYSESLFTFATLLFVIGLRRDWPLANLALISGVASGIRPVGIALTLTLVLHVYRLRESWLDLARKAAIVSTVGAWGLIAFMAFQMAVFDDALAFVRTQEHWRMRPNPHFAEKVISLAAAEPIWSNFVPGCPCYWGTKTPEQSFWQSLQFANPLYFLLCIACVVIGFRQRLLSRDELLLSLFMLAIPYLTRSYEMCMASHGRFAAVVVPMYLLLGRVVGKWPLWAQIAVASIATGIMATYCRGFFERKLYI